MNKDKIRAFADKVYGDMAGAMAMGMAYIGVEKGLFGALATGWRLGPDHGCFCPA
jgi:hypothetical protein